MDESTEFALLQQMKADVSELRKWYKEMRATHKHIVEVLAKHDATINKHADMFENVLESDRANTEFQRETMGYVKQLKRIIEEHYS